MFVTDFEGQAIQQNVKIGSYPSTLRGLTLKLFQDFQTGIFRYQMVMQ